MTENQPADRLFLTWLEFEAPDGTPEGLLDRIENATGSVRPRPTWIARVEGHHMDVIEGGRRSGAPGLGLILAVVVIAMAALAGAVFVGTRLAQPPVAPAPSQPAVLTVPSAAPASSAKAPASTPALPAPAALQGRWRAEIARSVAILTFTATGFTIDWLGVHSGRINVDGDEITFSGNRDPQCPDGGTYRWSIEGDKLHLEPVGTDPCPFQAEWAGNQTYSRYD